MVTYRDGVKVRGDKIGMGLQWNLRREDNLGAEVLSFVQKLSLSRRFTILLLFYCIYNNFF